jgi:hypothetical protein
MRFPHFWHRQTPSDPDDEPTTSRAWRDSGLADEVQAYLAGALVDRLSATRQPVPVWAVLNRLAHADRADLLRLVEGADVDWVAHPSSRQPYWMPAERFVAGDLLAAARTPEDLGRTQRATLVPLELALIERSKIERLTPEQVLNESAEALDSFRSGR